MKKTEPGSVQMRIMTILRDKKQTTAREISDTINEIRVY